MDDAATTVETAPRTLPWLPATHPVGADPRRPSRTVAVLGAGGGVGASTLAAGLAHGLRRSGGGSTLVDLDVAGGGVDVLLGIEDEPGARWPELAAARGDVDGVGLLAALPRWHALPVLSASRLQPATPDDAVVVDVVTGLLGAGEDVVLDLPRPGAWTPAARVLAGAADALLLVVPCTACGVAAALAALERLRADGAPEPWLVARGPAAGRVDAGALEAALGRDVVAEWRWDPRLAAAVERGEGPRAGRRSSLGRATSVLAGHLEDRSSGRAATRGSTGRSTGRSAGRPDGRTATAREVRA